MALPFKAFTEPVRVGQLVYSTDLDQDCIVRSIRVDTSGVPIFDLRIKDTNDTYTARYCEIKAIA